MLEFRDPETEEWMLQGEVIPVPGYIIESLAVLACSEHHLVGLLFFRLYAPDWKTAPDWYADVQVFCMDCQAHVVGGIGDE